MAKKPKRDWLEPPDWWKKWKPLRWVAGGIVLISIFSWIRAYLDSKPVAAEHGQPERVAVRRAPPPVEPSPAEPVLQEPAAQLPPGAAEQTPAPAAELQPSAQPQPQPQPQPAAQPPEVSLPQPEPAEPPQPEPQPEAEPGANPDLVAYVRIETQRAPFLEPFRSYDSLERVTRVLAGLEFTPEVTSHHVAVPDDIPPYNIDRVLVKPFRHLGVEGALRMALFNDRLYEVEFEPADAEEYLKALRKRMPELRESGKGRIEFSNGPLRVASTLDLALSDVGRALRTRPYVLWQDTRLLQQRDAWDPKYAREAAR